MTSIGAGALCGVRGMTTYPAPEVDAAIAAGVSDAVSEKRAGWDALAAANSRALQEDIVTRKSLGSHSPTQIEG
jgi:hypothetical protein